MKKLKDIWAAYLSYSIIAAFLVGMVAISLVAADVVVLIGHIAGREVPFALGLALSGAIVVGLTALMLRRLGRQTQD